MKKLHLYGLLAGLSVIIASSMLVAFARHETPTNVLAAEGTQSSDFAESTALCYELKILNYNGNPLVFESKEKLDAVLNQFKATYQGKKTFELESVVEVKLAANYSIIPLYEVQPYTTVEEALRIIRTGTDEKKVYKLQSGDNVEIVAKKFALTPDNIRKANPQIIGRETKMQIGEELSLIVPKPLLTVEVYKTATYDEKIPYEITTSPANDEYKTWSKIVVKGVEGVNKVKATVVEENGVVNATRTVVLEKTLVSQPTTQQELRGTLQVPPKKATGTFISPVYGLYTSSRYGMRDGGFHYGIDIPKSTGTSVFASDGGYVSEINTNRYAGTGLMITINHENGYQSRYMHLSGFSVKQGERVYQGQTIGSVGNTGNSTGPHLHFEIIRNGENINPLTVIR